MVNLWRTWQAWRRERRAKERLILGAYDSGRELTRILAALAFAGISDEDKLKLEGTELHCCFCSRPFKHSNKNCTLGFCPKCSK